MIQHDTLLKYPEFSVITSDHQKLVSDIILKLQETVTLATNDFLLVAAFLKNLKERSRLNHSFNFGLEISHLVTELQYIDALKQRLDHMTFFLEAISILRPT